MATKTFEELKQLAIQIRDEKTNKQNTATRVGTAMLEHINKLEQDYYDKTNIDEQSKNTTQSINNLNTKIDKRTTEYNVSVNHPTSGTDGTNRYDLAGAIAQVPAELRSSGLTVSFLNESGNTEKWEFSGGSWGTGSFSQVGAGKFDELDDDLILIESKTSLLFSFTEYKNKYLNVSGNFTETPLFNCKVTPRYFCKKGDVFKYKGYAEGNAASAIFYNDDKMVSYQQHKSVESYIEIIIPEGVNGVIFSSVAGISDDIVLDVQSDNLIDYPDYLVLKWTGNESQTRQSLASKKRKLNMQISYNHPDYGMINEIYKGNSFSDEEWGNNNNWERVPTKSQIDILESKFNNRFEFTVFENKFLNVSGNFTETPLFNCKVTPRYFCKKGDVFKYKGYAEGNAASVIFLENAKVVNYEQHKSTSSYIDIVIPECVNGVIFSSIAGISDDIVLDVQSDNFILYKNSVFKKRILRGIHFCGHSIWSSNNTLKGEPPILLRGYQSRILDKFDFDYVQDISRSGASLATLFEQQGLNLTGKAGDIYIIDTNTNDVPLFGINKVGTIDDYNNNTGLSTYYGALRVWVDKINELTENDNIIIFSNMCRAKQMFTSESQEKYIDDVYKFFNATLEICNKLNMYYIDQFNLVPINIKNYELCYYDKIMHHNNYGYQIAVEPWLNVLDQIYYNDNQP